jgi:hypothetical protein
MTKPHPPRRSRIYLSRLVLAATTVTVLCQSLSAVTDLIVRWTS